MGEIQVDGVRISEPGSDRGLIVQTYILLNVAANVGFGLKLQGLTAKAQPQQVAGHAGVGLSQFA